jgi:IclR family acetate operon transcriptional repressor
MARTGQPSERRVAAVERAVALLDALGAGGERGTNELARTTGLSPSTVSRLLATLAAGGLVEHVPATGRYRLGRRLLELGSAALAGTDLREVARPQLQALAGATGETATLSAPAEGQAVTVDFVQSAASVQSVARLGRPSVAHATATGKVLLAFGALELPPAPLERFTARTTRTRAALARAVEETRERGWAEAAGEREEDLNAIAAPVRGLHGELVAILGVQGPASRFGEDAMRAAVPALLGRAAVLSAALGLPTDGPGAARAAPRPAP